MREKFGTEFGVVRRLGEFRRLEMEGFGMGFGLEFDFLLMFNLGSELLELLLLLVSVGDFVSISDALDVLYPSFLVSLSVCLVFFAFTFSHPVSPPVRTFLPALQR